MSTGGVVLVVAGMSGAGKSTLINAALLRNSAWMFSVSTTTRPRREGEHDGREYHFVSNEEFAQLERDGKFLELASVYGNMYGTLTSEFDRAAALGKHLLIEVDVAGCQSIRQARPDIPMVTILPPSIEFLHQRLRQRGSETNETFQLRVANISGELAIMRNFDYAIENDTIDTATDDLLGLMRVLAAGLTNVAPRIDRLIAEGDNYETR